MNARNRPLVFLALCVALMTSWLDAAAAGDLSLGSAINKAGRQRMLTQLVLKAYGQIGLDLLPEASAAQLREGVALFDRQLAELKAFAPNRQIRDALARTEALWVPYRTIATGPINRDGAAQLLSRNEDVLFAADAVVQLLQDLSGTSVASLVNIAGRQRMLSQRVAMLYMLRAWGFDDVAIHNEMISAKHEFTGALRALQDAPENTAAIRRELDTVALAWEWCQHALIKKQGYGLIVADASNAILNHMDLITRMYEELLER